jgi:hypothetical protein
MSEQHNISHFLEKFPHRYEKLQLLSVFMGGASENTIHELTNHGRT